MLERKNNVPPLQSTNLRSLYFIAMLYRPLLNPEIITLKGATSSVDETFNHPDNGIVRNKFS